MHALPPAEYTGESTDMHDEPRVRMILDMSRAEAEALAAARIARGDSELLAADAKPVAHAVADALVAAGMGSATP